MIVYWLRTDNISGRMPMWIAGFLPCPELTLGGDLCLVLCSHILRDLLIHTSTIRLEQCTWQAIC